MMNGKTKIRKRRGALDSFLYGVGSILSIFPSETRAPRLKPRQLSKVFGDWRKDRSALAKDWQNVGDDFHRAFSQFNRHQESEKE